MKLIKNKAMALLLPFKLVKLAGIYILVLITITVILNTQYFVLEVTVITT